MAAGVSETRLPLITHNTLIFLLCSYVGSNGSCLLADCGYATQLPTFLLSLFNDIFLKVSLSYHKRKIRLWVSVLLQLLPNTFVLFFMLKVFLLY